MKNNILTGMLSAGLVLAAPLAFADTTETESNKESVTFSPLKVSADKLSSEHEAMAKPGAFSSRGENTNLQSTDSVLRSMPGTFTQIDPSQGTVDVNIRGMSGFGRVNTMIDGVTQNFYGSSVPGGISHGSTSSASGALIDPNFLVGIDVSRGTSAGSAGVNALAGSANLRTLGVDDVIFSGNPFGIRTRFSAGNNGIGESGMVAVAGKTDAFTDTGSFGIMTAISGSSIDAQFKNGDGQSSSDFGYEKSYRQNPKSQLVKVDIKPDEFNSVELSGRHYGNKFTQRDITSDDFYVKYHYAPFSELIDFNLMLSTSRGNQKYDNNTLYTFYNTDASNQSDAVDINNTSRFAFAGVDTAWSYGSKIMRNKYDKNINSNAWSEDNPDAGQQSIENNTFQPSGKQDVYSLYTGLELKKGIWKGNVDLNYSYYDLSGYKPACDPRVTCFPQGGQNISLTEDGFNPSVMLSAEIRPWFEPFVSYSKSMRGPNVQEVFFSNSGGASMNPFLKGERAETYQIGFNSTAGNLLFEEDSFRLKALYYTSKIKNYIYSDSFMVCRNGRKCSIGENLQNDWEDQSEDYSDNMYIYVNSLSPVRTHGVEIEAEYDTGWAFTRLSFSKEHTNQPTSIATGSFGVGNINELPEMFFTVDTGVRFLDESLTVGTLVKYTGKTRRTSPDQNFNETTGALENEEMPNIPTIIDLYSTYEFNRNLMLKFSVQNLMDKDYSEALNKLNSMYGQNDPGTAVNTARGRTYLVGGEVRF